MSETFLHLLIKYRGTDAEAKAENLRKMILAISEDLRVVFIKLADRLHNMQTLAHVPAHKRKRISDETLEIYAPLAERLGFGGLKGELEDLAFKYAYPKEFNILLKESHPHMKNAYHDVGLMKTNLKLKLMAEGLKVDVHGRKKHLYLIF
ncbi:MAG: (P)ppGpp synthetase I, SpoT/RelA, partial [candidate division CPR2 bacterium GW2011_GWD1_39_7]